MDTLLLKGKPVADSIKDSLKKRISDLADSGIVPGLATILVGHDPASEIYVRNKVRAFKAADCHSVTHHLPEDIKETDLLELIMNLNASGEFHGILVQLPLPGHISTKKVLESISPDKDVDGFHPVNLGKLLEGSPGYIPCTPHGILKILEYYKIPTSGRHAVILGRSNIVGKPMFALLAQKLETGNCTVTICHTATPDLSVFTRQADIIIAASGVAKLVTGDMIKTGTDIIDVGINRVPDESEKGYHIEGDVDIDSVMGIANSITPVPGGVGPMTITMLLYNTVTSAEHFAGHK